MKVVNYEWRSLADMRTANRSQDAQSLLRKLKDKVRMADSKKPTLADSARSKGKLSRNQCTYQGSNITFSRYRIDEDTHRDHLIDRLKHLPMKFAGVDSSLDTKVDATTDGCHRRSRESLSLKATLAVDIFDRRRIDFSRLRNRTQNRDEGLLKIGVGGRGADRPKEQNLGQLQDSITVASIGIGQAEKKTDTRVDLVDDGRGNSKRDLVQQSVDEVYKLAIDSRSCDRRDESTIDDAWRRREIMKIKRIQQIVSKRREMRDRFEENKSAMDFRFRVKIGAVKQLNVSVGETQEAPLVRRKFILMKKKSEEVTHKFNALPKISKERSVTGEVSQRELVRQPVKRSEFHLPSRYPKPATDFVSQELAPWRSPESADRIEDLLNF